VLVVQPGAEPVPGADTVAVGELDPGLAPAVAAVPFQLVAWRVAVERGLRPGQLEVATKVTTRE
jgi:glucosamine 6-phosphate synthetase-like amidotransferase/phosphosugar isomerase protein